MTEQNRMENQYVTTQQLEERCRGCHAVDNLKHDEATMASNRLALAIEKLDARLDKITEELQSRLPKWASVGGIVTFSLLTGTIGYLAKAAGIG